MKRFLCFVAFALLGLLLMPDTSEAARRGRARGRAVVVATPGAAVVVRGRGRAVRNRAVIVAPGRAVIIRGRR